MGDPACLWDPGSGLQIRGVLKSERLTRWSSAVGGLRGVARQGRLPARALAILDSRSLVRTLFLASAVRFDLIEHLRSGRSADELAELCGSRRPDRLRAWLQVGVDLGELGRRGDRYQVAGRRRVRSGCWGRVPGRSLQIDARVSSWAVRRAGHAAPGRPRRRT